MNTPGLHPQLRVFNRHASLQGNGDKSHDYINSTSWVNTNLQLGQKWGEAFWIKALCIHRTRKEKNHSLTQCTCCTYQLNANVASSSSVSRCNRLQSIASESTLTAAALNEQQLLKGDFHPPRVEGGGCGISLHFWTVILSANLKTKLWDTEVASEEGKKNKKKQTISMELKWRGEMWGKTFWFSVRV